MAFFGNIGRAMIGAGKAAGGSARGMKPPMKPQGGIGPSPQGALGGKLAMLQQKQPPSSAMQDTANRAFGRTPPPQQGNQMGALAGRIGQMLPGYARPQLPPIQPQQSMESPIPEATAPASPVMDQQQGPPPEQQQNFNPNMMAAMGQMAGRFGPQMGMRRPMPMPREDSLSMPDESVDQMRRNKFAQMRQGGIGPRFGGGGPIQY